MRQAQAVTSRPADRDAVLGCVVAVACGLAFLVFVALPVHLADLEVPAALEGLWFVGLLVGAFLGPVATGLAAFASGSALLHRGPALPRRARRLHVSTLVVSAALLVAYVASAGALRTWLD